MNYFTKYQTVKLLLLFLAAISYVNYAKALNLTIDPHKLGLVSPNLERSSASTLLTPYAESSLATEFVRQLRARNKIVEIPEVEAYINQLGRKLSLHSGRNLSRFKFFVVDSPEVNAFAALGGAIGIYKGLVLKVNSESELASVLAHEIAHVSQHHIERTIEAAKDPGHLLTQALLIAIAVASGSSQVGQAAVATAQGVGVQRMINYTRHHEKEADNIGLKILTAAGFDPNGMLNFMQNLLKMKRFTSSSLPSYLLTHPLTAERVANLEQRIRKISTSGKTKNTPAFNVIKQALSLNQGARQDTKGVKSSSDNIYAKLLTGKYYETRGDLTSAQQKYQSAYRQSPGNTATIRRYAQILIRLKNYKTADTVLNKALTTNASNPHINRLMAKLKAAQGKLAESYFWQANYEFLSGRTKLAIRQLNTARTQVRKDFYLASKIDARLKEFKRVVELEKK